MKTLTFKNNCSDSDKEIIKSLQKDYSISFRKLYNNIELLKDPEYLSTIKIKSKKQIEYLQKEVEAKYKTNQENKENIKERIKSLTDIKKPNLKQFRHLQYLKKILNKNICFGNKSELRKITKGETDKTKWNESRLLPLVFYGETSRYGNRFFNLKDIINGNILFKLESTDIKIPIKISTKKHKDEIALLQQLILDKEIPVTVKLTSEKLYITFDESILNGTYLDINKFYQEINHIKDKTERKGLIRNKHIEHENWLKGNRLDRYLAIDQNPDGIGYCIVDKDLNIIDKGFFDISKALDANKRKYETTMMVKELFKIIHHYRCYSIIVEELNLKVKNYGNKVSNRKINNLWNRVLIDELIRRRCNETGILRIEVNPAYSSFIGNIMYNEFDPIAASLEIARRGVYKYSKGGFSPEFDVTNFINDLMYDKIKGCQTWRDLYLLFVTSKRSYRRELKQFNFVAKYLGNMMSNVKHYHFI